MSARMSWVRIKSQWKEYGQYIGDFQARLLLTVFYFTILLPYGFLVRLLSDPLRIRGLPLMQGSAWTSRKSEEPSLARSRQQF